MLAVRTTNAKNLDPALCTDIPSCVACTCIKSCVYIRTDLLTYLTRAKYIWTRLILSHAESNCRSVHRERGRGWSFGVIIIKVTRAYNHNNGRQPVVRGAAARNERGYPTDTAQCRHTRVRELSLKAKRRAVGGW